MIKITNNKIIYLGKIKDLLPQLLNISNNKSTLQEFVIDYLVEKRHI